VALLTELLTRAPSAEAAHLVGSRNTLAEANRRNTEVVHASSRAMAPRPAP
jgi:ABC-type protease/lipase transport system fused ATPase/permease subunit